MGDDQKHTQARILERLQDGGVQESLSQVFSRYVDDLQELIVLATMENAGVRPKGLVNEIYAAFHHLARALSEETIDFQDEFRSARESHLKRAILDSYKIAINAVLREDEKLRETLDYLVLVEDFARYVPDGLNKINEIKSKARSVKDAYRDALRAERHGQFDQAIASFNTSLEQAYELRPLIETFTKDKTYLLACAREAKISKEKCRDRRTAIIAAIISAVLTATLTLGIPALFAPAPKASDRPDATNNMQPLGEQMDSATHGESNRSPSDTVQQSSGQ